MEISKAFDKVNHEKLLKLHGYGIRVKTLRWIKDFLNSRSQTFVLEGDCSKEVSIALGVPQGSVLSPILFFFNLYINNLHNKVKSQVKLFADDTAT